MSTPHPIHSMSELAAEPAYRTIDGVSIRFIESEARGDSHALLLSPWPESILAYEPTWQRLAQTTHLVAIDLPGFGRSEGQHRFMSPQAMGDFIVRAADAFGLEQPHVIGPDVGTSASLFAAAKHPGRLRSLVIGAGGAAVPLQLGEPLHGWVHASDLEQYRHMGGRPIVERAMQKLERHVLSETAREDYFASYEGHRFAESMRYVQSFPKELPVLRDLLPRIQTPVLIVSGRRDAVVPPVNAEYLHERLPRSELHLLDAGHFVWEDAADEFAALVTAWWNNGHKA